MKSNYKKGVVLRGLVALIALCLIFGWAVSSTVIDRENIETIKTYKNEIYGYSFDYPRNWKLIESQDKKIVTLNSDKMSTSTISGSSTPDFVVNIIATSTKDFGEQNTKYGSIRYDSSKGALVDVSSGTVRCLPSDNYIGVSVHATTSVPVFHYGGSIMSTPAHSESAILTNKDFILLVSDSAYESDSGDPIIFSSLKLIDGVGARIPVCATGSASSTGLVSSSTVVIDNTQVKPLIESISTSSGPIGTILELKGKNLSGFEGDLNVVFERSDGKKLLLVDNFGDYEKTQDSIIRVIVKEPCKKGETVYGAYSGIASICDYSEMTPGIYKIYTEPWGVRSNEVKFTVTK